MSLATYQDANSHLDGTKLAFANANEAADDARNADTCVRSALSDLFPDHVNLWDVNPTAPQEQTPELVELAAGLLMAAYLYDRSYSEDTQVQNSYAARLQAQADAILAGLNSGVLNLADKPDYVVLSGLTELDFWPNNTTIVSADRPQTGLTVGDPDRKFTMDMVF